MSVEIKNLDKWYKTGKEPFRALNNVNLSIDQGEIGVILGPSGSGKSTLLNIIGGIDKADMGNVVINNLDITKLKDHELTQYRRTYLGFVFQFYNLIPNLTVYENVEVAANISKQALTIDHVLDSVELSEFKHRFPRELSGGQQQRVSVARAIVKNPKLLLCDEPTGALDYDSSREILKLLSEINQEFNTTILIITHNPAISSMANRVIRLRSGEIVENKINNNILAAERVEW